MIFFHSGSIIFLSNTLESKSQIGFVTYMQVEVCELCVCLPMCVYACACAACICIGVCVSLYVWHLSKVLPTHLVFSTLWNLQVSWGGKEKDIWKKQLHNN